MAETKVVACATGTYTALSAAGQTNVSFRQRTGPVKGRWVVAASQPAASSVDFIDYEIGERVSLSSLAGTDVVYFQPENVDAVIEVIRG